MTTVDTGNAAEHAVAEELERQGYKIVARNWKTKYCEVDIIAIKDDVLWFIEVKYRATDRFGDGLEYVGHSKMRHLYTAAELWVASRRYYGEYTLGAVAVTANNTVGELVEI